MDFQTFKTRIIFLVNSVKPCDHCLKSVKTFINDIEPGNLLLIEFPLIIESRYSGGAASFSIEVTNLNTSKTLKMRSTELRDKVLRWLDEVKEIEML